MFLQLLRINLSLSVWKLCAVTAGWTGGKGLNYVHFSRSVYLSLPLNKSFRMFSPFFQFLWSPPLTDVCCHELEGGKGLKCQQFLTGAVRRHRMSDGKNLCVSLEHTDDILWLNHRLTKSLTCSFIETWWWQQWLCLWILGASMKT